MTTVDNLWFGGDVIVHHLDLVIVVVRDEDVSTVHVSSAVAAAATERHVAVSAIWSSQIKFEHHKVWAPQSLGIKKFEPQKFRAPQSLITKRFDHHKVGAQTSLRIKFKYLKDWTPKKLSPAKCEHKIGTLVVHSDANSCSNRCTSGKSHPGNHP